MRSILVPAVHVKTFEGALQSALVFAREFDSHLIACHAKQPFEYYVQPAPYPLEINSLSQARKIHEESTGRLCRGLQNRFHEILAENELTASSNSNDVPQRPGASANWISKFGDAADILCRHGRVADLIVMQDLLDLERAPERELREQILLGAGRPIFIAPKEPLKSFPEKAVIGWNGSLEASRAVAFALPLLSKMKEVTVLTVGSISGSDPTAEDLRVYLLTHQLESKVIHVACDSGNTEHKIWDVLAGMKKDLFIMGGYSRSRIRERIFGGVTCSALNHPPLPILITH